MDKKSNVAALWGSAENEVYTLDQRLGFALEALKLMSELVPGWDD